MLALKFTISSQGIGLELESKACGRPVGWGTMYGSVFSRPHGPRGTSKLGEAFPGIWRLIYLEQKTTAVNTNVW